jgi:hypothetical protein
LASAASGNCVAASASAVTEAPRRSLRRDDVSVNERITASNRLVSMTNPFSVLVARFRCAVGTYFAFPATPGHAQIMRSHEKRVMVERDYFFSIGQRYQNQVGVAITENVPSWLVR